MVVAGYNLSLDQQQRDQIFTGFSLLTVIVSVATSLIAVCQWLNIDTHFAHMLHLIGNRPYGNFGQPIIWQPFLLWGY